MASSENNANNEAGDSRDDSDISENGVIGDKGEVVDRAQISETVDATNAADAGDIPDITDTDMQGEADLPGPGQAFFIVLGMVQLLTYFFLWVLEPRGDEALPFYIVIGAIYFLFFANFVLRAFRAPSFFGYLSRNWLGVITILVPFLLSLRFLFHMLVALARWYRGLHRFLIARGFHFVLLVAVVLIILFSGVVYRLEHGANPEFSSYGASLWWAMATVTTIGYGDVVPVTSAGRFVGVGLMLVGIGVFGALTANLSAYFVEASRARRARLGLEPPPDTDTAQNRELNKIVERLEHLERANGQATPPGGSSHPAQTPSSTADTTSKT